MTVLATGAVVLGGLGFARLGDTSEAQPPPSGATRISSTAVDTRLTVAALDGQQRAVAEQDEAAYRAGWDQSPRAQRLAVLTYSNLKKLGVARLQAHVTEPVTGTGGSWTASVIVTWGLSGLERATSESTLVISFVTRGEHAVITSESAAPSERAPIWLAAGLLTRRGPRTLVAATAPATPARVDRLVREAAGSITRVLPDWRGDLVAYVPGTVREFDALLGTRPGEYQGIAAVTTTVDGSHDVRAPTAIVVNPQVFDGLGPIGAHVVVTHEATHVATHAAVVALPLWVAEGFADYVAIGAAHVPTPVAARAALRVVRRDGPPNALPSDSAFAVGAPHLEATYEQAWLATSLIAATYGRDRLVAFYRDVEAHPQQVDQAFRRVLNTTPSGFTRLWRGHLHDLVRAG